MFVSMSSYSYMDICLIEFVMQYKFLVDNSMRVDNQQPFVKDQTLGTISNYILVPEPEFIHPTIEASSSTMDIDNNGILRSEVSQSFHGSGVHAVAQS